MKVRPCICAFFCMMFALIMTGCKKESSVLPTETSETIVITAAPSTPVITNTPEEVTQVEVTQVTAMYFPDTSPQPMLYAAIEVKNTGTSPACVSNVTVTFNTGAYKVDGEFSPMLYKDDVIQPGETCAFALWQKYEKEPALRSDSAIKVSAKISFEAADAQRQSHMLIPDDVRLIDNYPKFSTLTGLVRNPHKDNAFSLSLFYAAMYDEDDQLICVWHFTENVSISPDESRNFVSHLKALPISGLSERVARIDVRCIGID